MLYYTCIHISFCMQVDLSEHTEDGADNMTVIAFKWYFTVRNMIDLNCNF